MFSQEQKYEGNSRSSVGCASFGIRIAEPLNSLFSRKHICSFGNIYSFSWEPMLSCKCFFISSNTHRSQDYNPMQCFHCPIIFFTLKLLRNVKIQLPEPWSCHDDEEHTGVRECYSHKINVCLTFEPTRKYAQSGCLLNFWQL